jgi:hypothetical protein
MVLLYLVFLVLALIVFFLLRKFTWAVRLIVSAAVFLVPSILFTAFLVSFGDPAPPDSIIVDAQRNEPSLPHELVVFPGARAVKPETQSNGTIGVTYELDMPYPATGLLQAVHQTFSAADWRPMVDDWLNPGLASSHSRGWTSFIDGTRKPEMTVHQWMAQWQNVKGDVVLYVLRYDTTHTAVRQGSSSALCRRRPRFVFHRVLL